MDADLDIEQLSDAIEIYKELFGRYPTTEEGLSILDKKIIPPKNDQDKKESIIDRVPLDPWGREYYYILPGKINNEKFDIWTLGEDGEIGGENLNSDCGNWKSSYCKKSQKEIIDIILGFLLFGSVGFILALPPYIFRSYQIYKKTRDLKTTLKGFHLGMLVYFTLVFLLLPLLFFVP